MHLGATSRRCTDCSALWLHSTGQTQSAKNFAISNLCCSATERCNQKMKALAGAVRFIVSEAAEGALHVRCHIVDASQPDNDTTQVKSMLH